MKSKNELSNEIKNTIGFFDVNKRCNNCLIYKNLKSTTHYENNSQCLYSLLEYTKKYNKTIYNNLKTKLSSNCIYFFPCDSSNEMFEKAVKVILSVLNINYLDIE